MMIRPPASASLPFSREPFHARRQLSAAHLFQIQRPHAIATLLPQKRRQMNLRRSKSWSRENPVTHPAPLGRRKAGQTTAAGASTRSSNASTSLPTLPRRVESIFLYHRPSSDGRAAAILRVCSAAASAGRWRESEVKASAPVGKGILGMSRKNSCRQPEPPATRRGIRRAGQVVRKNFQVSHQIRSCYTKCVTTFTP